MTKFTRAADAATVREGVGGILQALSSKFPLFDEIPQFYIKQILQ
jgi:hypothetical protein